MLHAPTGIDQFGGQIVEQGGVLGLRRTESEIEHGLDQGIPKVPHPDVVHRHPGGQWILP